MVAGIEYEFIHVISLDQLNNGERVFIEVNDHPIVLFNVANEIFAIGDLCTHDDGPLGDGDIEDHVIICPRHGARFDIRSGKALSLPAIVDTPFYPTRIVDGQIEIGFPIDQE